MNDKTSGPLFWGYDDALPVIIHFDWFAAYN